MDKEKILQSFIENKEILEKRNAEGIEKYRKGDFTLKFTTEGKKKVTVKQIKHKFLFGCNAFMLNSFEKAEKEVIYKEKFTKLFNQAVVPFYWRDLEPEEGKLRFDKDSENIYRRPAPDLVLDFCKEYAIEPKGHCLLWDLVLPKWFKNYNEEEKKEKIERRFKEIAERYADKIPSFDIVNESASNYNHGRKVLFEDYEEFGLKLGAKYFPNNRKILNETNGAIWRGGFLQHKYMPFNMQLKDFLRRGLPFDEIGLQYHIFAKVEELTEWPTYPGFIDVANHLEVLEFYDGYDLPMHISEITIPAYWGKNEVNEEIQAKLVENLYSTWFATKNMKSIVWWNLVDGYGGSAPLGSNEGENVYGGGLLRFDMSEKPSYQVIDRLINHEWNTSFEKETQEDELSFRGFFGEYEITVENGTECVTKKVKFNENGSIETL
jgi:GH35 family endo-1,4-beta-xylanase